jgi:hypothetical protein
VRGEEGDLERPADATAGAFELAGRGAGAWFAWVHFYDPHYPYQPPESFRQKGARGAYDGEVAFMDAAIGRLRQALGRNAPLLTVFARPRREPGEHGEGTRTLLHLRQHSAGAAGVPLPRHVAPASARYRRA